MQTITKKIAMLVLTAGLAVTGSANALDVNADIVTDTTWTIADSPVYLKTPVFVRNAASLTIDEGVTVITLDADDGGLVVTRDSQIFIMGTQDQPVIMTSGADVATWTGSVFVGPASAPTAITTVGDRTTGEWRKADTEWRNLTVLGKGVISASHFGGVTVGPSTTGAAANPTIVDGTAQKRMEGLQPTDPDSGDVNDIRYGGDNDDDDSGTINYLSVRYTGRVLGTGDELNGLSLGGIGGETDIDYVDIMNNVDDGIEIWGGKVMLKHVNIWNIGDDSFDIDQGWRGKAQFGLIVQGYNDAPPASPQGSGVGDNCFEHDGGEQADTQPTTTGTIYNFTVIGQRLAGDGATVWRDNANVQYRRCIFMDIGEELVRNDNVDGDGGTGYGTSGTLAFIPRWSTAYSTYPTVKQGSGIFAPTAAFYSAQVDGMLCEITDSVLYNASGNYLNDGTGDAQDQMIAVGAVGGVINAPTSVGGSINNVVTTLLPIQSIGRDTPEVIQTIPQEFVSALNPLPANSALVVANPNPANSYFADTTYRGGFSPTHNWIRGWTAADAYDNPTPGVGEKQINISGNAAADPDSDIAMSWSITFDTVAGVLYLVEVSTDGTDWTPAAPPITGTGSPMTYTDTEAFVAAKLYRVNPL